MRSQRPAGVLLAQEQVDRFRVSEFDQRVGAHKPERNAVRSRRLLSEMAVSPSGIDKR